MSVCFVRKVLEQIEQFKFSVFMLICGFRTMISAWPEARGQIGAGEQRDDIVLLLTIVTRDSVSDARRCAPLTHSPPPSTPSFSSIKQLVPTPKLHNVYC
jgi:hypothetical protein